MQQVRQHCLCQEKKRENGFPHKQSRAEFSVSNKSSGIPPEKSKDPSLQLFQEESGFTTQVQHKIHLRENVPASRKFYRIPAAAWVIERSTNGEA